MTDQIAELEAIEEARPAGAAFDEWQQAVEDRIVALEAELAALKKTLQVEGTGV